MHIVICIKQVPDTNNVRWSKENNLLREGMISILNPNDLRVIEEALEIKKRYKNAHITALSMGPKQAKSVLEYALARGCDEAILLCDKAFAGSDTLSTGRILSAAIKKFIPDFNLILCGQFAADGDTAQTGPTIAGFLDIPTVCCVEEIINSDTKMSIVKQRHSEVFNILEVQNPSVLCLADLKDIKKHPEIYIQDYIRAQDIGVKSYGFDDLDLNRDETGILGSPTFVSRAFRLEHARVQKVIDGADCAQIRNIIDEVCKNGK